MPGDEPALPELPLQRAETLLEVGRPRDALAEMARAGAMASADPDAWALICRCHLALDDLGSAFEAARQVSILDPGDGYGFKLQAIVLNSWERPVAALQAAAEAVRLMPNDAGAHAQHALAAAGIGWGQRGAARESAHRAVSLAPNDPSILDLAGLALMMSGKRSQAREHFEAALRIQPDHQALRSLGVLDGQQLSFASAGANLGRSATLDPAAPENRDAFSYLLTRWLGVTHHVLLVLVLVGVFTPRTGWMPAVITVILLGLCGWGAWLAGGADAQVRRALVHVLRGSVGLTVWVSAVVATLAALLLSQYLPPDAAHVATWVSRATLLVWVVGSVYSSQERNR